MYSAIGMLSHMHKLNVKKKVRFVCFKRIILFLRGPSLGIAEAGLTQDLQVGRGSKELLDPFWRRELRCPSLQQVRCVQCNP